MRPASKETNLFTAETVLQHLSGLSSSLCLTSQGAAEVPEDDVVLEPSTEGSSDEEAPDHQAKEEAIDAIVQQWSPMSSDEPQQWFRHEISRCLHALDDEEMPISGAIARCRTHTSRSLHQGSCVRCVGSALSTRSSALRKAEPEMVWHEVM